MPWSVKKRGDKFCVEGPDGKRAGCHSSRAQAIKQQRALYANEAAEATVTLHGDVDGDDLVVRGDDGREVARHSLAELQAEQQATLLAWEGPLGLEGHPTGDRRYLIPGEMGERSMPLPINVQLLTGQGHENSANAGRVEKIDRIPVESLDDDVRAEFGLTSVPDGVTVVWGEGVLDGSEAAQEAERMLRNGYGISLDIADHELSLLDPETFEPVAEEDVLLEDVLAGKYLTGLSGQYGGATIVNIPAFEHAVIRLSEGQPALVSSAALRITEPGAPALTAAASWRPPREWFDDPKLKGPTPLTYTPSGRIYGHLALWDSCHTGFPGVCVSPPRSPSDYAYFNVGLVETSDGEIACGKLMFSTSGGKHAPLDMGALEASKHYDDSTKVGAYVRAGADRYGIWLAGAEKPGISDDEIAHLRANPPSGDWRAVNGAQELVAAFSVPVPGFPIPQAEARLVASGEMDEIASLIIGPLQVVNGVSKEHRRRLKALSTRRRSA